MEEEEKVKKFAIAGLAAGTVLAFAPAAHAAADPQGLLCGFSSVTDPSIEGSQTGEIDGGPLVLGTDGGVYTGSLTCTIQTGTNDTHAEADAGSITGPTTTGVVAAGGTVTYEVGADEDVWLCTSVNVQGQGTLYYDETTGTWGGSSGACALAISAETPETGPIGSELDPILCPILSIVFPPEGDVVLPVLGKIWDCPPYDA
jgi:hypothetical protein